MATKNTPSTQQVSTGMSEDTRTIITVLLLIFVYPIGLIFMWFWTRWPRWVKIVVSIPVLFFIGILAVAMLAVINPSKQIMRANCAKACENVPNRVVCMQTCINTPDTPLNK